MEVYHYLKNTIKVKGKIGIYGRSLGGIPSTFLAKHINMAIIDRSFCNFSEIAKWSFHGSLADKLFKTVSLGWQAQNDFFAIREADKEDEKKE